MQPIEADDSPLAGIYHFQQLVRLINEGVTERKEELDNLWSLLRDYVASPNLGLPSLQVATYPHYFNLCLLQRRMEFSYGHDSLHEEDNFFHM